MTDPNKIHAILLQRVARYFEEHPDEEIMPGPIESEELEPIVATKSASRDADFTVDWFGVEAGQ